MRADADRGVHEIVELMTSGRWVAGAGHADIALRHGVAPATVKDWATSASRVVRLLLEEDREVWRARLVATLECVTAKAVGAKRRPDLRAAVAAIGEQAKILGLVSQRVDVTTRPSVGHLSREEHLAELAKLAAEIAAEQARLGGGAP